ncbi:MAG: hypothetical protein DSZ21_00105 [Tenericutes bacterium]|nr:MAG: hypothetical protein DSZ21_00105 [Mycoplasmatota bacterium]
MTLSPDQSGALVASLEVINGHDPSTVTDDMIKNAFSFTDSKGNALTGNSITVDKSSLTEDGGSITITVTDADGNVETLTFNISITRTSEVQSALNGLSLDSLVSGAGASTTIKGDLSSLSTGDLKHFTITATISKAAVDGTSSAPDGTDGEITITATPKDGFVLSGGESSLSRTITIPKVTYIKVFATENDLINAVKGFADDATKNLQVGNKVQVGSGNPYVLTQDKFDELKMKNSYKGTFSSDAQKNAFLGVTTQVSDSQFKDEHNLTFISLPKATDIAPYAFQFTKVDAIDLPEVTSIGTAAFGQATALHEIDLPKVETIAQSAFANCPITSLKIPLGTTIADNAFTSIDNKSSTHVTLNAEFNTSQ